jgi:hypothetical protein
MKTKALRLVRQMWAVPGVPKETQRHNMRQWARSIKRLGDKWLLAKNYVPQSRN